MKGMWAVFVTCHCVLFLFTQVQSHPVMGEAIQGSWLSPELMESVGFHLGDGPTFRESETMNGLLQATLLEMPKPVGLQASVNRYVAKKNQGTAAVTLTLQGDIGRLERIEPIAKSWQGPISFAVLTRNADETQKLVKFMEGRSSIIADHVSVHLFEAEETFQHYPINVMRNHAIHNARTEWVYVLDLDEVPVGTMNEHFTEVMKAEDTLQAPSRPVYAVAAFQWGGDPASKVPDSKSVLVDLLSSGAVGRKAPHTTGYLPENLDLVTGWPDLSKAQTTPYHDTYEPYFIARKSEVLDFDPRFVGWGGNKHVQTLEMALQGATYAILPNVFSFADENPKEKTHAKPADQGFVDNAFKELGEKYGCKDCTLEHCVNRCRLPKIEAMPQSTQWTETPKPNEEMLAKTPIKESDDASKNTLMVPKSDVQVENANTIPVTTVSVVSPKADAPGEKQEQVQGTPLPPDSSAAQPAGEVGDHVAETYERMAEGLFSEEKRSTA